MQWILGAGAAASATLFFTYASKSPSSQLFGATFVSGVDPNQVALTYDDGPNDPYTFQLLELLEKHQAKATFFVVGKFVKKRPDIVRAIADAGHALGNHTFSHPNLTYVSMEKLRREIEDTEAAIADATGRRSTLFRPPFGARRPGIFGEVRRLGMIPTMWSVTTRDWKYNNTDEIERHTVSQLSNHTDKRGDVILLHDGDHLAMGADRSRSVEITERLLLRFKNEGRECVTVPTMMKELVS
ncbi:MAG: polysaccharide deacetylase [Acidobacteriales bacterium]|nr:polysaccharide deacetylase [Terriglobales bacterium]